MPNVIICRSIFFNLLNHLKIHYNSLCQAKPLAVSWYSYTSFNLLTRLKVYNIKILTDLLYYSKRPVYLSKVQCSIYIYIYIYVKRSTYIITSLYIVFTSNLYRAALKMFFIDLVLRDSSTHVMFPRHGESWSLDHQFPQCLTRLWCSVRKTKSVPNIKHRLLFLRPLELYFSSSSSIVCSSI